jgi:hypothetical protein
VRPLVFSARCDLAKRQRDRTRGFTKWQAERQPKEESKMSAVTTTNLLSRLVDEKAAELEQQRIEAERAEVDARKARIKQANDTARLAFGKLADAGAGEIREGAFVFTHGDKRGEVSLLNGEWTLHGQFPVTKLEGNGSPVDKLEDAPRLVET